MENIVHVLENEIFPICLITMIGVIFLVVILGFIAFVLYGCHSYDEATTKLEKIRNEISDCEDSKQRLLDSIEDLRSQYYILESKISRSQSKSKRK